MFLITGIALIFILLICLIFCYNTYKKWVRLDDLIMLKDWNKVEQPTAEVDKRLANAKNSLLQQQIAMKEKKLQ